MEQMTIWEGGEELWRGPGEFSVARVGRGTSWRVELAVPLKIGLRFQAVRRVDVEISQAGRAPAIVQGVEVRGAAGGTLTRVLLKGKGPAPSAQA